MDYRQLFGTAVGRDPYPYQEELATTAALPDALVAPTGAGKTAAVAMAWLYRRRFAGDAIGRATARRLILCLPMRVLVEQTAAAVRGWLRALDLLDDTTNPLQRTDKVGVHVLMGGAERDEWHLHPERDAVLVGTQDMLLSRALNRGYGASRFMWPWHFGLVTNDCWWVFDEVQLMGVGLATGLQLSAFRVALGSYGPAHALYMSATLDSRWLATVDHPAPDPARVQVMSARDLATPALDARRTAPKALTRARTTIGAGFERALGDEVLDRHVPGSRTIVVLNTVDRAVGLFEALHKKSTGRVALALLHSRFRQPDRDATMARVLAPDFDGIVVSTQVIEAGVDVSARTLFAELAPWASLVQRAGRCNRAGELPEADVVWIDRDDLDKSQPYEGQDLLHARNHLLAMTAFNPAAIEAQKVELPIRPPLHVLRRRDVIDLFDTTPDLAGSDVDVSRFIREGDERDAQVFWREVQGQPDNAQRRPARAELCSVPANELESSVQRRLRAWRWNHVERQWEAARRVVPGAVYMLDAAAGGYRTDVGWDAASTTPVDPLLPEPEAAVAAEDGLDDDYDSFVDRWVPLATHSLDTRDAARAILQELGLGDLPADALVLAAQAHDLGKAHPVFQATMTRQIPADCPEGELWAKSGTYGRHERRGFRHELASALAWLAQGNERERDLVAYLLATHHGKVRLSIRALPSDAAPDKKDDLHARGIWKGDALPAVDLGDGVALPALTLDLTPMQLGRRNGEPSWAERALGLRERFGPFRLAFLEALVRAADLRATLRERRRDADRALAAAEASR